VKVFWRQKARVVLRLKISGMIVGYLKREPLQYSTLWIAISLTWTH
jgi:hypothetical protein